MNRPIITTCILVLISMLVSMFVSLEGIRLQNYDVRLFYAMRFHILQLAFIPRVSFLTLGVPFVPSDVGVLAQYDLIPSGLFCPTIGIL